MKTQSADRTAVLIVRLWIEADHERGLRARITRTLDTMMTEHAVAVVTSAEDICSVVKQWVQDFAESGSSDRNGPGASASNGGGS